MSTDYGLAVDIGTTTITAGLVELAGKKEAACLWLANPQARFGQDVISRIDYCVKNPAGLMRMRRLATGAVNLLIKRLSASAGVSRASIKHAALAGNTAMEHFFLGVQPSGLAQAPYASVLPKGVINLTAEESGLALGKGAKVYILPIIKSFVGSDLTAGLLHTNLCRLKGANLLVDIGTNGELALSFNGKILAASTAAGPAFEAGAGGLTGSQTIDEVAFMLKNGIIDGTGRIKNAGRAGLSQQAIRNIQLAKAAIMAGIHALVKKAGLGFEDINNLYVAGKFGSRINKSAAVQIGLLPKISLRRIKFAGNTAYKGVVMALCCDAMIGQAELIAKKAVHVGLFGDKNFKEEYVRNMSF